MAPDTLNERTSRTARRRPAALRLLNFTSVLRGTPPMCGGGNPPTRRGTPPMHGRTPPTHWGNTPTRAGTHRYPPVGRWKAARQATGRGGGEFGEGRTQVVADAHSSGDLPPRGDRLIDGNTTPHCHVYAPGNGVFSYSLSSASRYCFRPPTASFSALRIRRAPISWSPSTIWVTSTCRARVPFRGVSL